MKVVDLSYEIEENMTAYTNETKPYLKKIASIESDGYNETKINIFSHNGTHIDSPYHMISTGRKISDFQIENFIGKAIVIDVSNIGHVIEEEFIKNQVDNINEVDFVLFKTNWSRYWKTEKYFYGFPVLSKEAASYLSTCNIKGIGIDAISVDKYDSIEYEIHNKLLKANKLIIENLTNLGMVKGEFIFIATPLNIKDLDGCPVRAIGILEK